MASRDHDHTAGSALEDHTPGQLLLALSMAFFDGGGWAEPFEWWDFDEAGHAQWEAMAEQVGRDLKLAVAAPDVLEALRALQLQALQSPDLIKTEWGQEALAKTKAAIAKAEAS